MHDTFCLPIQKTTQDEVLKTIAQHRDNYAFFEVWIDHINHLDRQFIDTLASDLGNRLVIVFRHGQLEPMQLSLSRRFDILEQLSETGVRVDLDIMSQEAELHHIAARGLSLKTIVSFHDYQSTPDDAELQRITKHIAACNPSIIKVATMCQTKNDALRLLQLQLQLQDQGQPCIVLGMGQHGVINRVFGTLWGNELIFAPDTQKDASAPGQLTRTQLTAILEILGA